MRRYFTAFLLFLAFVSLFGCASIPDSGERGAEKTAETVEFCLDTWSSDGTPLFLGTSRRLHNREDEWEQALYSAASQAAIYHEVIGLSKVYTEDSHQGKGTWGEFDFQWDRSREVRIAEGLEEVSRIQDEHGTYMLFKYPDGKRVDLPSRRGWGKGRPSWLNEIPTIPGYLVSLGSSGRMRNPVDAIMAADQQALEEMIKMLDLSISTQRNSVDFGSRGTGTVESSFELARATVRGFMVVARWHEPNEKVFYSLAICPEGANP